MPPASPPIDEPTSSSMPRRVLTKPCRTVSLDTAPDVAITVIRPTPAACRTGSPKIHVSAGTRKMPPPRPSSAPDRAGREAERDDDDEVDGLHRAGDV